MTPKVECESQRLNPEAVPIHQCRRVLPEESSPARAWLEDEEGRTTRTNEAEEKCLLHPANFTPLKTKPHEVALSISREKDNKVKYKPKSISKFEKTKDKIINAIKPPCFTFSMIMILVSIHLFVPEDCREWLEWTPGREWWHQPWRLVTYGLVHANAVHLALNAVVAMAVGWRLEYEQSWWRVMCVWVGGVVAGGIGAGLLQPEVRVVGASAAVYALLTAHLPNVCLKFGHIPLWWFRPLSVIVLGASETCWALMRGPITSPGALRSQQDNVAWSSHVLGAAIGIPLAFIIFKADKDNEDKTYIRLFRAFSATILTAAVISAGLYYTR
ncbi:rhomboid-related protein 2 [Amyelois transitella]|uniref:rhomboid-related protein 2 n=1 Tax=Amyelois transitella TaxID=680683 RepID=UPI00298FE7E0|nr:rhomboid-related protein 2 [Amyelois transitella]